MASPLEPKTSAALPSPPFVQLDGIANFRDLGGYPVAGSDDAKSVRRGYVFRCAEPTKATDDAVARIREMGITHIYDLRSRPEIEKLQVSGSAAGVVSWPGVERVFSPVFPDESYDPVSLAARYADYQSEGAEGMVNAYRAILRNGTTAYGTIARHILERPPPQNALILHCTAGKDRTGVIGALLLSLCGVSDEVVAGEYNLTEAGLGEWADLLVQSIVKNGTTNEAAARRMMGARKQSMLDTLAMLREEFGGAEGYFKTHCGLSQEEVDKLVQLLVVEKGSGF